MRAAQVEVFSETGLDQSLIIPLYAQNATQFHGPTVTGRVSDMSGLLMLTQMQRME